MLGLLIGLGIFGVIFVLYCCLIVAGQCDREMIKELEEINKLRMITIDEDEE